MDCQDKAEVDLFLESSNNQEKIEMDNLLNAVEDVKHYASEGDNLKNV